jgi:hypothetical protein
MHACTLRASLPETHANYQLLYTHKPFTRTTKSQKEHLHATHSSLTRNRTYLLQGGFAELPVLHGSNGCTISRDLATDKLPTASTCFNMLKLPEFPTEYELRRMALIAIRHGAEGFTFS